jgi:predicted small secreted protein
MHRLAIPVTIAILACAGCNTVSGVGKDVQLVGKVVTKTANEATRARGACTPDNSRAPPRTCPAGTANVRYVSSKPAAKPAPLKASTGTSGAQPSPAPIAAQTPGEAKPASAKPVSDKGGWYVWP